MLMRKAAFVTRCACGLCWQPPPAEYGPLGQARRESPPSLGGRAHGRLPAGHTFRISRRSLYLGDGILHAPAERSIAGYRPTTPAAQRASGDRPGNGASACWPSAKGPRSMPNLCRPCRAADSSWPTPSSWSGPTAACGSSSSGSKNTSPINKRNEAVETLRQVMESSGNKLLGVTDHRYVHRARLLPLAACLAPARGPGPVPQPGRSAGRNVVRGRHRRLAIAGCCLAWSTRRLPAVGATRPSWPWGRWPWNGGITRPPGPIGSGSSPSASRATVRGPG